MLFDVFDIESNENCNLDYIEIHEINPAGTLLYHGCGNEAPTNISATGGLWIKFKSDDQGSAAGFLAKYSLGKTWSCKD